VGFCRFPNNVSGNGLASNISGCFWMDDYVNQWLTWTLKVYLGDGIAYTSAQGVSGMAYANSAFELYVQPDGQSRHKIIDWNPAVGGYFPLDYYPYDPVNSPDGHGDGKYAQVTAFPYLTLPPTGAQGAANAYYDEFIISPTDPGEADAVGTISPGVPTISSISPGTGVVGTVVNITITGTNLGGSSPTLTCSGAGDVVVSARTTVNSTTWTATLTIANSAVQVARTLTVSTADGSAAAGFAVTALGSTTRKKLRFV
jgi:hypothetical protein